MRVSIIGPRAYPFEFVGTSGVEKYINEIVRRIEKKIKITIYTKNTFQRFLKTSSSKSVKIVPLPVINHKFFESITYSFLASVCASFSSDNVVWYHGMGIAIFCFIPKFFGKKIVVTVHSLDWKRKKWTLIEKFLFTFSVKLIKHIPDVITTVSYTVQKDLLFDNNIPSNLTLSGINIHESRVHKKFFFELDKFKLEDKKYFLYIGRFAPEKRLEWLLRFFIIAVRRAPYLHVVLAGGATHTENYVKNLQARFSHPHIHWLPYIFGEEKTRLMKQAQAIVVPSELEGLPIVALEAIEHKCKVVIAKQCIDVELASLDTVYTYEKSSFVSFVAKLCEIMRPTKKSKGKNELIFKQYNWEKTARTFTKIFYAK